MNPTPPPHPNITHLPTQKHHTPVNDTNDKALAGLAIIILALGLPFAAAGLITWAVHILHTQWTPAIPTIGYWTAFWVVLIWGTAKLAIAGLVKLATA